jgi:hypothetical protein
MLLYDAYAAPSKILVNILHYAPVVGSGSFGILYFGCC